MLEENILEKFINKIALKSYEKQKQKEKPIYGIVTNINSEYDENGFISKIYDITVAYSLKGELCTIIIPNEKAYLGCFPIYPGLVVKFCNNQLNSQALDRKMKNPYIIRVDKRFDDNFPKEVYEIAKMYIMNVDEKTLDPSFWINLDLGEEEKRNALIKKTFKTRK